jgi:hypothetical protein
LPPSLREWLPEDHLAWLVLEAVGELDLRAFYRAYRDDGHGRAALDPAMMVALLVYAYAVDVRLTECPKSGRVSRSQFRGSGSSRCVVDGTSVGGDRQRRSFASPGGQGHRFAASGARPCRAALDSPTALR